MSGCFDPITVGHFDIIKRAALLFDNVVVAISANSEKKSLFSENLRVKMVKASVAEFDNVRVELCAGLLAEFCSRFENPVIVRGARSGSEFDYERSLFIINKGLGIPETVVLPAESGLDHISSTYVRELIKYNKPIDSVVPFGAKEILEGYLNDENNKN